MMRSMMTVGRIALFSGRACCQNNRFLIYQSSHQYYNYTSRINSNVVLSATRRLLFSNASNYMKQNGLFRHFLRKRCTGPPNPASAGNGGVPEEKQSLFQRFKKMWKDYWYVMVPVHIATSTVWFGAFYKVAASGVDLGYYLRQLGIGETVVKHITDSGMGNIAVAWALYKVATPARYAITLGGTTLSINVLRNMGYIKPANVLMAKGRDRIQSLKDKKFPGKD